MFETNTVATMYAYVNYIIPSILVLIILIYIIINSFK